MTDEHRQPEIELDLDDPNADADDGVSIDDEMHEIYADLNPPDSADAAAAEKDTSGAPPPSSESSAAADGERPRGPDGKFLPRDEAAAPTPASAATSQPNPTDAAPDSLRPAIKAMWKGLPQEVREEFHKREQDFFKGISQYQSKAQVAETLWGTISPYKPIMDALGADVPTALNDVLRTAAIFYVGTPDQKAATLRALAQVHGIQLAAAAGNTGPQSPLDPVIQHLQRELAQVKGELTSQRTQSQNSEVNKAWGEIVAFRSNPENKYFANVSVKMGQLMNAGLVGPTDLAGAYKMACELTPEVKAAITAEQSVTNAAKTNAERNQRTAAARRAGALGVRSTPAPMPTAAPGSMEDTMRRTLREIQARG